MDRNLNLSPLVEVSISAIFVSGFPSRAKDRGPGNPARSLRVARVPTPLRGTRPRRARGPCKAPQDPKPRRSETSSPFPRQKGPTSTSYLNNVGARNSSFRTTPPVKARTPRGLDNGSRTLEDLFVVSGPDPEKRGVSPRYVLFQSLRVWCVERFPRNPDFTERRKKKKKERRYLIHWELTAARPAGRDRLDPRKDLVRSLQEQHPNHNLNLSLSVTPSHT